MLLHAALIAIEEHVIHLFLVVYLQSFFLHDKPRLEVLQLLPQPNSLLFSLLFVSLHGFLLFSHPTSFSSNCLILFLCLPQQTSLSYPSWRGDPHSRPYYRQCMPSWFWLFPAGRKVERAIAWDFELRLSPKEATEKLLWNKRLRQNERKREMTYHLCRLEIRVVLHGHTAGNDRIRSVVRKSCHK